jgi:hypothetical protein
MASIEGYGGRAGNDSNQDCWALSGLLPDEPLDWSGTLKHCSNVKCSKRYLSRQDGDDYCSEACDLDANRGLRASQNGADLCETSHCITRVSLRTS